MKIKSITPYQGAVKPNGMVDVYDLTVADTHAYCANGIIVSNSKRVSLLEVNALLSHGAHANLRDIRTTSGQRDDENWLQFMQGYNPQNVKVPIPYEKLLHQLKASGINVIRNGSQLHVMAMTSKDVDHLAGDRELTSGETVDFAKALAPIRGGLFDPQLTGGHGGKRWSYYKLHEPMPNPVMEEPVRRLLGLTRQGLEDVIAGKQQLGSLTGPKAITRALEHLQVDREIAAARHTIKFGKTTARDEAVRRLYFLLGAKDTNLDPKDWILNKVPVLPPAFRPVSVMSMSRQPLVADANYLYKELFEANSNLHHMDKQLGHDHTGEERLAVYRAFKAVTGLGDPITRKSQDKQLGGILKQVFGSSPKYGSVQRKLLSNTVDNIGRAVITPDPGLDMDQIGLPEDSAFGIYSRFIARRLRRRGLPLVEAMKHIKDKTPLAREMLLEEMSERPVRVSRSPVLHKFGILAFWPQLTKGSTLKVPPLVVKGFNADFDGDQSNFQVPGTEEARRESIEKLLPSKSLLSQADFKTPVHMPTNEYAGGLYLASTAKTQRRPRVFATRKHAIEARQRGELGIGDPIQILEDRS